MISIKTEETINQYCLKKIYLILWLLNTKKQKLKWTAKTDLKGVVRNPGIANRKDATLLTMMGQVVTGLMVLTAMGQAAMLEIDYAFTFTII